MLNVAISLTLGNRLYEQHCHAMRLRRTQLAALDRLEIVLPVAATFDAEPGADCSLDIDGGDGAATVFTGQITRVRYTLSGLYIEAQNGGLALARYRPSVSFEQQTIGDIINNLCSDVDVDLASNIDGARLALYVADGRATAAQEIARLALLAGAAGGFDGDGSLHVNEDGGPGGELALRFGRELLAGQTDNRLADDSAITVVGEGAAEASSDRGRWIITDFLRGGGSQAGPDARTIARPELRTTDDTEFAAAALTQRRAAGEAQVRLRTWLHPELQPGMRLEFADMPEQLPLQECRIRQVVSTISPSRGATTEVWATGQVSGASAFGALPGGLGGLI
jgi:hypothetical protein